MPHKKVLFISHDASRIGAPIILLNFLEWFKKLRGEFIQSDIGLTYSNTIKTGEALEFLSDLGE